MEDPSKRFFYLFISPLYFPQRQIGIYIPDLEHLFLFIAYNSPLPLSSAHKILTTNIRFKQNAMSKKAWRSGIYILSASLILNTLFFLLACHAHLHKLPPPSPSPQPIKILTTDIRIKQNGRCKQEGMEGKEDWHLHLICISDLEYLVFSFGMPRSLAHSKIWFLDIAEAESWQEYEQGRILHILKSSIMGDN